MGDFVAETLDVLKYQHEKLNGMDEKEGKVF